MTDDFSELNLDVDNITPELVAYLAGKMSKDNPDLSWLTDDLMEALHEISEYLFKEGVDWRRGPYLFAVGFHAGRELERIRAMKKEFPV